ncbi:hypothetical protein GCM10027174_19890 [Salinifilum aidingensis]
MSELHDDEEGLAQAAAAAAKHRKEHPDEARQEATQEAEDRMQERRLAEKYRAARAAGKDVDDPDVQDGIEREMAAEDRAAGKTRG